MTLKQGFKSSDFRINQSVCDVCLISSLSEKIKMVSQEMRNVFKIKPLWLIQNQTAVTSLHFLFSSVCWTIKVFKLGFFSVSKHYNTHEPLLLLRRVHHHGVWAEYFWIPPWIRFLFLFFLKALRNVWLSTKISFNIFITSFLCNWNYIFNMWYSPSTVLKHKYWWMNTELFLRNSISLELFLKKKKDYSNLFYLKQSNLVILSLTEDD